MTAPSVSHLRDEFADLRDRRLHYVEAGEGPLVVLLHGFPEFWYGWRGQIQTLAANGFRVVAPDMRGYNRSSRPVGARAYAASRLATDVRDLIRERGADRAFLAGHDWGGVAAWTTAMEHPQVVERLAILNVPHPRRLTQALVDPRQLARSWYMLFFQLPWLAERFVRARRFRFLRSGFERDARPGAFTHDDLERYIEAWSRPGAPTAMLNYYRAALRGGLAGQRRMPPVDAPTLVIWGVRDRYFRLQLATPGLTDVPNLTRVVRVPGASHWVQHDEPELVARLLSEFFGPGGDQRLAAP